MTLFTIHDDRFMAMRGRPRRKGPPSDLERERGRRVAAWIQGGMKSPLLPVELNNRDVAKLTGLSPSMIGYYVNDCYDSSEDRMKFPSDDSLEKIAKALRLSSEEGRQYRYWSKKSLSQSQSQLPDENPDAYRVYIGEPEGDDEIMSELVPGKGIRIVFDPREKPYEGKVTRRMLRLVVEFMRGPDEPDTEGGDGNSGEIPN